MDQSNREIPLSPSRLTERRGKPELQLLDSTPSIRSAKSSISSLGSSRSAQTTSSTSDVMSIPATPIDSRWYQLRMLHEDHSLHGKDFINGEEYRGLGSNVNDRARHAAAFQLSQKLQAAREFEEPSRFGTGLGGNFSDAVRTFGIPPTPPYVDEEFCDELHFLEQGLENFSLDEEAFSSEPLTPISPSSQPTNSRNRRVALLSKVLPQRLRENIKRRMSGQPQYISQSHSIPAMGTSVPDSQALTPSPIQSDWPQYFDDLSSKDSAPSHEPIPDPQFILPIPATSLRQWHSPLQSPRSHSLSLITNVVPDVFEQVVQNEVVLSPLQPPTISPLQSPTISVPLMSLNMLPPLRPEEQNVPSINPSSTTPSRKASAPIDLMSSDTVSKLTAEMERDDEAYTFMIQRMISHGWSSPEEIRNLEIQREECQKKWQRKIAGAKRVLDGLSKCGFSTPFQFPQRSVNSMDTVRSDDVLTSSATPPNIASPSSSISRTYSQ